MELRGDICTDLPLFLANDVPGVSFERNPPEELLQRPRNSEGNYKRAHASSRPAQIDIPLIPKDKVFKRIAFGPGDFGTS